MRILFIGIECVIFSLKHNNVKQIIDLLFNTETVQNNLSHISLQIMT